MSITPTTVVGNLTADPELTYTTSKTAKLTFSIASNSTWTDSSGEKQEKTSYFNIVAWGYMAENTANILEKGLGVIVVGSLEQRSWEDKDGQKRSTVEIKAQEIGVRTGSVESIERRKPRNTDGAQPAKQTTARKPATQPIPEDDPF